MKTVLGLSMVVLLSSLLTVGCTRQDAGMVAGGVIGGAAGHALTGGSAVGTVAGAVGGGYIGRQVTQ
jgi:osmotically inducible lipoprotein OsmB